MKQVIALTFGLLLFSCGSDSAEESENQGQKEQQKVELGTLQEEVSYCIGYSNCQELKMNIQQSNGMLAKFLSLEEYYKGFRSYLLDEEGKMTREEAESTVANYFVPGQMPDTSSISVSNGSYALGIQQAYATQKGLSKSDSWESFSPNLMVVGFEDALYQNEPQLPKEEINKKVIEYMSQMNRIQGEKFLKENGARPEVTTTESGLQYEIIEEGKGGNPGPQSSVTVFYKGTFLDGNQFDARMAPQEPIEFRLTQVIAGWTEGITYMKKGAKYKFYIPFNLAYGHQGNQGIPPYSTLIFEVELIDFK